MEKEVEQPTVGPESLKGAKQVSGESWNLVQEGLFEYPIAKDHEPALLANRCRSCGQAFFPKRNTCPKCFDQGVLEEIRLSRRGIIYACTVVRRDSPVGISGPYAYGYVDIPANRVRVFALLTGADPGFFAPGQEVELVVEPLRTDSRGTRIIGYKFRLVS